MTPPTRSPPLHCYLICAVFDTGSAWPWPRPTMRTILPPAAQKHPTSPPGQVLCMIHDTTFPSHIQWQRVTPSHKYFDGTSPDMLFRYKYIHSYSYSTSTSYSYSFSFSFPLSFAYLSPIFCLSSACTFHFLIAIKGPLSQPFL